MRKLIAAAGLLIAAASVPAQAQYFTSVPNVTSRADCIANFRAGDVNRDGFLSPWESDAFATIVPTQLANREFIARQDYLRACRQLVRNQSGN